MAIGALVFDVFGTVVDWRSVVARALAEAGVPGDPGVLADEWRHGFWPVIGHVVRGERPWANFDELHRETLDALLAEHGVHLDEDERRRLVAAWHCLDPWPDAPAGLEELRGLHITAALSNGHTALLVDLCRHGDLRFDCLISAELSRSYKPAREVYESAPRLLGLEPDEVMLVAAHPLDLEGARRVGLRSAFVDRPLEYGPDSPPREDPKADLSVADLHELAERLAAG